MNDMEEGFSIHKPLLLRGPNYGIWKNRMRAFIKAQGGAVWRSIEVGWTEPVEEATDTIKATEKLYEDYTPDEQKKSDANDKVINYIFGAVDSSRYRLISNCTEAKCVWDILEVTHEGNEKVKIAKYQLLMTKFENIKMEEKDTITEFHGRIRDIANQAEKLEEPIPERTLVLKVLRSLPERFRTDVKAIRQAHDMSTLSLDDPMGNLETVELELEEEQPVKKTEKHVL